MPKPKLPLDVLEARGSVRKHPERYREGEPSVDSRDVDPDDGYLVSDATVPAFLVAAAAMVAAGCTFAKADNDERYAAQLEVAKTGKALRLSVTYHGPSVTVKYEIAGRKDDIFQFSLPRAG